METATELERLNMIPTFVESLKNTVDIRSVNTFFQKDRARTLKVLREIRPEGRLEGNRYKLASLEGGAGGSFDFNVDSHFWGDWAKNENNYGLVNFVSATLKMNFAQTLLWMAEKKYCTIDSLKKKMAEEEGDPLLFPIPEEMASWEVAISCDSCRKDKAVVSRHWEYRDTDGSLLGFVYRVDGRRTAKEIYTLTYRADKGWTKKAWGTKILPVYGLEEFSRKIIDRVLFVEGEKARERAKEILPESWAVLAYSGVRGSEDSWLPNTELWGEIEVYIWPDNDAPGRDSARCIEARLNALEKRPKAIKIVRVDQIPGLPKKWDLGDWEPDCGIDVEGYLSQAEDQDSFEVLSKEWVYVVSEKMFYSLRDSQMKLDTHGFDLKYIRYALRGTSPSKQFVAAIETRKVDHLDFVPGEEKIISAGPISYLNEWEPSRTLLKAYEIAADESVSQEELEEKAKYFIEHVKRVCGEEIVEPEYNPETNEVIPGSEGRELWDALMWHFSELVRRPMDKRGWVPLLVSENNGTGKSYFGDVMAAIHGGNRVQSLNTKRFLSEYQDWMDGTLFYEVAEVRSVESVEVYNEIKKYHNHKPFSRSQLEERGQGFHQLNVKGKAQKKQRDFLNGYITANDLYPLALVSSSSEQAGDRRLLVIRCEKILSQRQTELMFEEELRVRPEWIAAYLLRFVPKYKWNPSWAPVTQHKKLMLQHDRKRATVREEKQGLGKATQFLHFAQWAVRERTGCFGRKVLTGEEIRELADVRRIPAPYEREQFLMCLERVGIYEGPQVTIPKVGVRTLYTFDRELLDKPEVEWIRVFDARTPA